MHYISLISSLLKDTDDRDPFCLSLTQGCKHNISSRQTVKVYAFTVNNCQCQIKPMVSGDVNGDKVVKTHLLDQ